MIGLLSMIAGLIVPLSIAVTLGCLFYMSRAHEKTLSTKQSLREKLDELEARNVSLEKLVSNLNMSIRQLDAGAEVPLSAIEREPEAQPVATIGDYRGVVCIPKSAPLLLPLVLEGLSRGATLANVTKVAEESSLAWIGHRMRRESLVHGALVFCKAQRTLWIWNEDHAEFYRVLEEDRAIVLVDKEGSRWQS